MTYPSLIHDREVIRAIFEIDQGLVRAQELFGLAVCANSRHAGEGLAEVGVERTPEKVVETLQFAGTLAVEPRGKGVEDEDAGDDEEEPLLDDGDEDDGTDDAAGCTDCHTEAVRQGVVDRVDVLGEPILDPAERSRVEEAHRRMEDTVGGGVVQAL